MSKKVLVLTAVLALSATPANGEDGGVVDDRSAVLALSATPENGKDGAVVDDQSGDDELCGYCEERKEGGEYEHRMSGSGVIVNFCHEEPEPGEECDESGHNWDDGRCNLHIDDCFANQEASLLREMMDMDRVDEARRYILERRDHVILRLAESQVVFEGCVPGGVTVPLSKAVAAALQE